MYNQCSITYDCDSVSYHLLLMMKLMTKQCRQTAANLGGGFIPPRKGWTIACSLLSVAEIRDGDVGRILVILETA